jgi:glycosyltransferase XagB
MDDGARGVAASSVAESINSDRLDHAVWTLAHTNPDLSAHFGLARWQSAALVTVACIGLAAAFDAPRLALIAMQMVLIATFACLTVVRVLAIAGLLVQKQQIKGAAPACPTNNLPTYTIIVALKDEAAVARQLVDALTTLDYPAARLDILIALETHDHTTRAALLACGLPAHMRLITVPPGSPRTKPRALAFALTFARGDYVVVYDAEDEPDPQQLRTAVAAFQAGGARLGCVQARLTIDPHTTGMLGRQFAIE